MPTFSAIALDRFLDPGPSTAPPPNTTPSRSEIPPRYGRSSTVVSVGASAVQDKKVTARPQMSPALYTTPKSTPLPDCPTSSFPPSSPYLINHKRRGPRLMKSFSDKNVVAAVAEKVGGGEGEAESKLGNGHSRSFSDDNVSREMKEDPFIDEMVRNVAAQKVDTNRSNGELGVGNGEMKIAIGSSWEKDSGETEDFFDPQDSVSYTSNSDCEDYIDRAKLTASGGEFFDASEELSCDSGRQQQRSLSDVEIELREMRLSFFMEIERRKQAEEALNIVRSQWLIVREKLRSAGLILPDDLSALSEDSQSDINPAEDICRQIHLARFVSESIGRGIAKAEAEAEMDAQLEVKNFEIARLSDRLNYYETMNKEMTQRNQEAIEVARCQREKRRRCQKWIWSSIGATITLGSVALAWSYMPTETGSSSSSTSPEASETASHSQ